MYRLLSLLIVFTVAVSCTQPDNKDKNTEETTESKQISQKAPERDKTVVAKVNDTPIHKYKLDKSLVNPLREAIVAEVLLQEAIKKGYRKDFSNADLEDPKVKSKLITANHAAVQLLRAEIISNVNVNKKITDKEINDYYNKNINKYTYVTTLKYTLDADEQTSKKVRGMLVGGSSVSDIRDEYSDQGLKISVEEKKMTNNPIIFDNLDVVEVGAITKPIRFAGNYDIYKVTGIKKVEINKIKASLKQNIRSLRKRDAIYNYVDNLIESDEYNVTVLEGDQKVWVITP